MRSASVARTHYRRLTAISVPATAATSTGTITTSNANDFVFAAYRFASDATPSAGSSWTAINASGGYYLSEYQITSATQTGLVATASTADENGGIVDAVQAGSSTTSATAALTVVAGSTLDLNGTTITGGSLTNAGTVDVTGGSTSTLNSVSATNSGGTAGAVTINAGSTLDLSSTTMSGGSADERRDGGRDRRQYQHAQWAQCHQHWRDGHWHAGA